MAEGTLALFDFDPVLSLDLHVANHVWASLLASLDLFKLLLVVVSRVFTALLRRVVLAGDFHLRSVEALAASSLESCPEMGLLSFRK